MYGRVTEKKNPLHPLRIIIRVGSIKLHTFIENWKRLVFENNLCSHKFFY